MISTLSIPSLGQELLTSSKHCEFIVVKALAPAGLKVNHVVRIVLVHVVAVVTEMPAFEIKSLGLES